MSIITKRNQAKKENDVNKVVYYDRIIANKMTRQIHAKRKMDVERFFLVMIGTTDLSKLTLKQCNTLKRKAQVVCDDIVKFYIERAIKKQVKALEG